MCDLTEVMTMDKLNEFLKQLKLGAKNFDSQRMCVEMLESKGYPTAKKERERYEMRVELYLKNEAHFYEIINCSTGKNGICFTENEREILISHYILGEKLKEISKLKYLDKSTICRILQSIKNKLILLW